MKKFNAYGGSEDFKGECVSLAKGHQERDEYTAGDYGREYDGVFKGCSVGCTINDIKKLKNINAYIGSHEFLAEQLGVPIFITRLQDCIFEGLPSNLRSAWTPRFLEAINVGADLTSVLPKFLKYVLLKVWGVVSDNSDFDLQKKAVKKSLDVITEWIETGTPNRIDAAAATHAANVANAPIAAYIAEGAYAIDAAYVADTTHVAVRDAAYFVAFGGVGGVGDIYTLYADELIALISECK